MKPDRHQNMSCLLIVATETRSSQFVFTVQPGDRTGMTQLCEGFEAQKVRNPNPVEGRLPSFIRYNGPILTEETRPTDSGTPP